MTENSFKIVFVTGTRADFGKLKSLILRLKHVPEFEIHIFVTGMHMLSKYGYTCEEVEKSGLPNIHKYINQNNSDSMDHILAKTISGLSDYVKEISPSLIVLHGDRVETLAGAAVGAFNNILTAHIEGGEVSGTVDESIRHAVTKLSHIHFVANEEAKNRLVQLGELKKSIYVIGSPDMDLMSPNAILPLDKVKSHYDLNYKNYAILMFHPVVSELDDISNQIKTIVDSAIHSGLNYIVIYPNNDPGSDLIINEYKRLSGNPKFKVFPSMRFEYFLSLLKNAQFILGNSSSGVREAPYFGVPTINLGTRQQNRVDCISVINKEIKLSLINETIAVACNVTFEAEKLFGGGNSDQKFHDILMSQNFWKTKIQKYFIDQKIRDK